MEKRDWGILLIFLIVWTGTGWFCYQWGKKDCADKHEIILSKKTENIKNHAKVKDTIRTESDDAVVRRALENYDRAKRERAGGSAKGL